MTNSNKSKSKKTYKYKDIATVAVREQIDVSCIVCDSSLLIYTRTAYVRIYIIAQIIDTNRLSFERKIL